MGHEKHDLSVSQWTSKDVESQCTLEMEHTFGIINVALRYTEEEQDHHSIHGQEEGWECRRRGTIRKTESRFPSFMQSSKYLQGTRVPSAFYCADHLMWILLSNCQRSSHSFSGTTHLRQTFPLLLPIDVWSDLTSQGLSSFICRMAAVTMSSLGGSASYRLACSGKNMFWWCSWQKQGRLPWFLSSFLMCNPSADPIGLTLTILSLSVLLPEAPPLTWFVTITI